MKDPSAEPEPSDLVVFGATHHLLHPNMLG